MQVSEYNNQYRGVLSDPDKMGSVVSIVAIVVGVSVVVVLVVAVVLISVVCRRTKLANSDAVIDTDIYNVEEEDSSADGHTQQQDQVHWS